MSYSLDFCKAIAADPDRSLFLDRDFNQADEFGETKSLLQNLLNNARNITVTGKDENSNPVLLNITLDFDPHAQFDYCTSEVSTHDGTFLFILETVEKCLMKVATGSTYYSKAAPPVSGSSIHYTIGNAVVLNEYSEEFAPAEKPWMRERTTVMLPIKYEVV